MSKSGKFISTDGVSIDLKETALEAKRNVDRDEDNVPIHACGAQNYQDCSCWTCTVKNCAACLSSGL